MDAGRRVHGGRVEQLDVDVRRAGVKAVVGRVWADRVVSSSLAEQAVELRLSSRDELQAIAAAWRQWLEQDDGFFVVVHAELIARRLTRATRGRRTGAPDGTRVH